MLRTAVFAVIAVLLAGAACAAIAGVRIDALRAHLEDAAEAAESYAASLYEDPGSAQADIDRTAAGLTAAQEELDAFPLAQLSAVPWAGPNIAAVEATLAQLQILASDTAPVFADAALLIDFDTMLPRSPGSAPGDWLDALDRAVDVAVAVPGAVQALQDAHDTIEQIDTSELLPQVRDGVDDAQTALAEALAAVRPVSTGLEDLRDRMPGQGG